jgi:hypothetical protein
MKKRDIEIAAMCQYAPYGRVLEGADVASVSRDRRRVTFRHVWRDDEDARVWAGLRRAAWDLAQRVADSTGRPVDIYSKGGFLLDQIEPRDE